MEKLKAGIEFIFSSYKRTAAVLFIAAIALAIPITVNLISQQQDIRQRAQEVVYLPSPTGTRSLITPTPTPTDGGRYASPTQAWYPSPTGRGGFLTPTSYLSPSPTGRYASPTQTWYPSPTSPSSTACIITSPTAGSTVSGTVEAKATTTVPPTPGTYIYRIFVKPTLTFVDSTLIGVRSYSGGEGTVVFSASWNTTQFSNGTHTLSCNLGAAIIVTVNNLGQTQSPTPTTVTKLSLSLLLPGIGLNSQKGQNTDPKNAQRAADIKVFNPQNQEVASIKGSVVYNRESGNYEGQISLGGNVSSGSYTVKVRLDNTLWKIIPGIQVLTAGATTQTPTTALVSGDFNQDNEINLLDYNLMLSCLADAQCRNIPQARINLEELLYILRNNYRDG